MAAKCSLFCCVTAASAFLYAANEDEARKEAARRFSLFKQQAQQQPGLLGWVKRQASKLTGSTKPQDASNPRPWLTNHKDSTQTSISPAWWPTWLPDLWKAPTGSTAQDSMLPAWLQDVLHAPMQAMQDLHVKWQALGRPMQVTYSLVALNAAVFIAWQIPRLHPTMLRHFTVNLPTYGSGAMIGSTSSGSASINSRPWTLLASNFSHQSALHLLVNMAVLQSFGPVLGSPRQLGPEQFAAFFAVAGLASTLSSWIGRMLLLMPKGAAGGYSLGASGALYACLGAASVLQPRQEIAFVLLPEWHAPLGQALPLLLAFDIVGVLVARLWGWALLDHLAHLGGAAFGIWYGHYGGDYVWQPCKRAVREWREQR